MPETAGSHWFEALADHMGPAYLRYSFTKGTVNEVDFLMDVLGLDASSSVLDVGCGPGRHSYELARRGVRVHGVDISDRFIELATEQAPDGATFAVEDARILPFEGDFDAVISLCQGGFGLAGGRGAEGLLDPDDAVMAGLARALRPGGRLALSAFSSYFQVRYLEDHDTFDAASGVNHEVTEVRDEHGNAIPADLWTTCFTPRELRYLARSVGLEPREVWSVTPGAYGRDPPTIESPEWLLVAEKPQTGTL